VRRENSGSPADSAPPEPGRGATDDLEPLRQQLDVQRRELDDLRLELARKSGYAEALQAQINVQTFWDEDLRVAVEDLQTQLVERDQELEALRAEVEWRRGTELALREEVEAVREEGEAVRAEVEWRREVAGDLQENLRQIRASRTWRWREAYQTLKRSLVRGSTQ
jgi:chromosome segregation ATPase